MLSNIFVQFAYYFDNFWLVHLKDYSIHLVVVDYKKLLVCAHDWLTSQQVKLSLDGAPNDLEAHTDVATHFVNFSSCEGEGPRMNQHLVVL